ncbi:MAG: M23 family metallopeptidase [Gemmatimonadaceae bacterium]|jgi:murein DD-endopeptidase MepM/ murein hydrolase activator NlpD|nr:M23 family metallopeptidase [Gemmatimonadaceae bacterium]
MRRSIGPGVLTRALGPWCVVGVLIGHAVVAVRAVEAQATRRVQTEPASPRPGTVFRVRVAGESRAVSGRVAGEPLHFVRDSVGWSAWAAAPVDSSGRLAALVVIDGDTARLSVALSAGAYRVDRLRVAPQFGRDPDSATAARIAREFAAAKAVSRGAHETPALFAGAFVRPRASRVTSGFGTAREFNGAITSRHTGVDFAGAIGAPVRAAQRGVVRLVGDFYYAGRVVYVDHGAGFVTAYFHLSRVRVVEGDTVVAGSVLGEVGATGRVTGPHLHFVARYGEISVDGRTLPGWR